MPRHHRPLLPPDAIPEWVEREKDDCLQSVGEEVYVARAMAVYYGAERHASCSELLRAGDKECAVLDNHRNTKQARTEAGERALRKFWEAKVCARRVGGHGLYRR